MPQGIIQRVWTSEEDERLRRLLATRSSTKAAAEALGRPHSGVQTRCSRLGLAPWSSILPATREGVQHFAREGWASSRISKRFRIPVEYVDHVTGRVTA